MSDSSTLDERYFNWLYEKVASVDDRDPTNTYWVLFETLFKTPFEWSIRNDENRDEDGRDLRIEYMDETDEYPGQLWLTMDSSIFEMMIAMSRRAAFQSGWEPHEWFWVMLENAGLSDFTDEVYCDAKSGEVTNIVKRILRRIVDRRYDPDGHGGFFPLRDPERDQRKVELWYQLSAYLIENVDY